MASAAAPGRPVDPVAGVDRIAALFAYDDLVQRMVLSAKNRGRGDVLAQLGQMLADQAVAMAWEAEIAPAAPYDLVTWVPASRAGARRRGFDHGAVLADAVAARLGVRSRRMLLRRRGQAQAGQGRADRLAGPRVRAPLRSPARVLLVDDVVTTGASMAASAAALRKSGAQLVDGLAVSWAVPASLAGRSSQASQTSVNSLTG